ncbi:MAG: hypothetical protein KIT48_12040 [Pseudolabrys sp.]|nr:hypothetical protein [Pseudolabrys sp.]
MKKKANAITEIEERIAAAEREGAAARESLPELEAARTAAIRNATDAEVDEIEEKLRLARRTVERADARLEVAKADLGVERERVRVFEQETLEERAEAAAAKAAERLTVVFGEIAQGVRGALRAQAEADRLIEAANRGRTEPLLSVEARCRAKAAVPRRLLSEETIREWVYSGTMNRIGSDRSGEVRSSDGQRGVLPGTGMNPVGKSVENRKFMKRTFAPAVRHFVPGELAATLSIPALIAGDRPIWSPLNFVSPEAVLAALDKLEASDVEKPPVEVEYAPLEH